MKATLTLAALLAASCCLAQNNTATLSGVVTDPAGGLVAEATVSAVSADTGIRKAVKTGHEGRYTLPFLSPGTYTVTCEAAGFNVTERRNLKLEVGESGTLDLALTLRGTQQTMTVTSESIAVVNSDAPGLEYTLENKLIEDLPSANRGALSMITSVPGVVDQGVGFGVGLNTNGNAQNAPIGSPGNRNFFDAGFAAGGGQPFTSDILLDGVSDTLGDFNGVAVSPPQDSVQEFKVLTGYYSAEFGRSGSAVVNFVTKSGGKNFHGNLYEYFQNGDLDANGWQRNRAGVSGGQAVLPRIPVKRNQFGGTIGGPVALPHFGRAQTAFFFFNYEGRRERNPYSQDLTMPTAKMRTGDLSELLTPAVRAGIPLNADGSAPQFGQIYSPFGSLVTNPNGVQVRNSVPGNRLDLLPKCGTGPRIAPCLDPVALAFLGYLPMPNQPGLTNNYLYSGVAPFSRDLYAGRFDKTLSDRHSFFGRISKENRFQANPNFLGTPASSATSIVDRYLNATFNDIYTFSPTTINNFRAGYTRVHPRTTPAGFGFDPTTLGLPSYIASAAAALTFPIFSFTQSGGSGAGIAGGISNGAVGANGNDQPRDTTNLGDTVTLVRGAHTFRTGVEYRLLRFFAFQYNNPDGTFAFTNQFTQGPVPTAIPSPTAAAGSSLASLLMGLPASASIQIMDPTTLYHHYGAAFVQDTWKVGRRLTFDFGLRWDVESGTGESHGQITNFDFNAPSPLNGKVPAPTDPSVLALNPGFTTLHGLLSFPSGSQSDTNLHRFAPRMGFAFQLDNKTTIRGGYGLSYIPLAVANNTANGVVYTTTAPQGTDVNGQVVQPGGGGSPTLFLTNPFPTGLTKPPGSALGAYTLMGQSPTLFPPNQPTSYMQQYNFVIQRQLPGNWVVDVAYNGSHGVRLGFPGLSVNQLPPSDLDYAQTHYASAKDVNGVAATNVTQFFTQQVANPFYGIITDPLSTLASKTVQRYQLLKPFPQYANPQLLDPAIASSKYNALQINVQKRFSNGLSLLTNYTFSKFIDLGAPGFNSGDPASATVSNIYNIRNDISLSDSDIPHRFTASFSYELPFGRNKLIGSQWGRATNRVLGGFQISGTAVWQSGTPLDIIAPCSALDSTAVCRANVVSGVPMGYSASTMEENIRANGIAFNTKAFTTLAPFTLGTAARTYGAVRRDSFKSMNLSLLKNIPFGDGSRKLQFRAEFLNAFNMTVFGTPDVNAADALFGHVTTQANQPRIIQLVLRLSF